MAERAATKRHPGDASPAGRTLVSFGGLIAALASMSCCVLPFALFFAGVSGAWIGNLTALAPHRPWVIGFTLAVLAVGFIMVYRRPQTACADGTACVRPNADRPAKTMLWFALAMVSAALAFPYAAPWFIGE
jgi:mercuric ion transport protein